MPDGKLEECPVCYNAKPDYWIYPKCKLEHAFCSDCLDILLLGQQFQYGRFYFEDCIDHPAIWPEDRSTTGGAFKAEGYDVDYRRHVYCPLCPDIPPRPESKEGRSLTPYPEGVTELK